MISIETSGTKVLPVFLFLIMALTNNAQDADESSRDVTVKYPSSVSVAAKPMSTTAIKGKSKTTSSKPWSGAYVGASFGYLFAKSDTAIDSLSGSWSSESQSLRDFINTSGNNKSSIKNVSFGGQFGYNFQAGGAVLGGEAEFNLLGGKSTVRRGPLTSPFPSLSYTFTNRFDPKSLIAFKGRAGAASGDSLFFGEGGVALVRTEMGMDLLSNGGYSKTGEITKTRTGFILGGGIERKLSQNVSIRGSYNYVDAGNIVYTTAYNPGSTFAPPGANYIENVRQDLRLHLVRVGLNFHF